MGTGTGVFDRKSVPLADRWSIPVWLSDATVVRALWMSGPLIFLGLPKDS
jgi:hypothetical protein